MKRRPATLIELLIGLSLTALLLGTLFHAYLQTYQLNNDDEVWHLRERLALKTRLSQIIPDIQPGPWSCEDETLSFLFNNGIDDDPAYAGNIEGTLSLEDERLLLTTGERIELLYEPVEELIIDCIDAEEGLPAFIRLHLTIDKEPLSFLFPLPAADKPIRYIK